MKRADCERRSLGIFANRETWDGEAEAERMSLASLLEAAFIACFLFLAIHRYLDILLELLLDLQKIRLKKRNILVGATWSCLFASHLFIFIYSLFREG